jgi:hypothetical protein
MQDFTRAPALAALLACLALSACWPGGRSTLPASLSDAEFRHLSESLSEPPGPFTHSDNLVSNEASYVHLARLVRAAGGVYVGVGPEQNFSYIARLRPRLAFIVDIRGENRSLHLLYKALFEISEDRDAFVSRLFSRARQDMLGPQAVSAEIFAAYGAARPSPALLESTRGLIREHLTVERHLRLRPEDLAWMDHVLDAFHADGPAIHYARSVKNSPPGPSYATLMTAADITGQARSFLASEQDYAFVRSLHLKNAIVPVVGDFAGPAALRRIGDYVRRHGDRVTAFYASNVEVYLNRQKQAIFCANLAALPHGARSSFIGSKTLQPYTAKLDACKPAPQP